MIMGSTSRDAKNLYFKLTSLDIQRRMEVLNNAGAEKEHWLALLTPSQLTQLFPGYYKKAMPDMGLSRTTSGAVTSAGVSPTPGGGTASPYSGGRGSSEGATEASNTATKTAEPAIQDPNEVVKQALEKETGIAVKLEAVDPGSATSGTWKNRVDVSPDGRPASVRYNNPGAAYPSEMDEKYGLEGYGIIGGGHKIGKFPSATHGLAANMDLFGRKYTGMTIQGAVNKWRGGNGSLNVPDGFNPKQVISADMAKDPNFIIPLFRGMSKHEAGRSNTITDDQLKQAFEWYSAGGIENAKKQLSELEAMRNNLQNTPKGDAAKTGSVAPTDLRPGSVAPPENMNEMSKTYWGSLKTDNEKRVFVAQIEKLGGIEKANAFIAAKTIAKVQEGDIKAGSNAADIAMTTLGLHERRDKDQLRAFLKKGKNSYVDPVNDAWCASFVNSSLEQAGIKGTQSGAAGSFQKWGEKVSDPSKVKKGDVLVNYKPSPRTGLLGSHVEIARGEAYQKDGRWYIPSVSGNKHDDVSKAELPFDSWNVRRATPNEIYQKQQATTVSPTPETGSVDSTDLRPGGSAPKAHVAPEQTTRPTPPPEPKQEQMGPPPPPTPQKQPQVSPGRSAAPPPPQVQVPSSDNVSKAMQDVPKPTASHERAMERTASVSGASSHYGTA